MKFHPIAEVWPLMGEEDLAALAEDITRNGLLEPVWTYEGKILDGRNRWLACQKAGVDCPTRAYTGESPVAFAFAQNERRRHLSSGQRAALAVEIKPRLEEEAAKRRAHGQTAPGRALVEKVPQASAEDRKSRTQAARITGTNPRYVSDAERIKEKAPETFDRLKAGKISLQDAKREVAKQPTDPWSPSERERQKEVKAGRGVLANAAKDKNLVQWAEQEGLAVLIDRQGPYGNPFLLDKDGTRDEVCEKYGKHYLPHKPSILSALDALRGKVLVCHCFPERCHGDELLARIGRR